MVSWADVILIAPQLAGVPAPAQAAILTDAALQIEITTWDFKYDLGIKYLAAHLGQLYLFGTEDGRGTSTAVASETVGQVSRSYAFPANFQGSLDTTLWGQEFKRLLRGLLDARMPLVA